MGCELWWSPAYPFSSSITGQSAKEFADGYTEKTGKQWIQPTGFVHMTLEAAIDCLVSSEDGTHDEIRDALASMKLDTIAGHVDTTSGPVKNVATLPIVGDQWRRATDGKFKYEPIIVSNVGAKEVPVSGSPEPITW